jgi:EF-P beta-lysylation protein EpmB
MITRTSPDDHVPVWQRELARAVTKPEQLLRLLQLQPEQIRGYTSAHRQFPLRVPRSYIARMRQRDPQDPLLLQVLPVSAELNDVPGYTSDPLAEHSCMPVPGVIRKYTGRVLLTVTGACGVHCRYCFRRHFPYADANPATRQWDPAIDYINSQTDIHEVILSGGDPLSLSDSRLAGLLARLQAIPHLSRLRVHTRLPVVLPERVDDRLLNWLQGSRLRCIMVLHLNHPNEIDASFRRACGRLRTAGVTLLNQSVLLKGVNDNAMVLSSLSESLFSAGVLPYYLHRLDRVQGAAHFEVSNHRARAIMDALHAALPGYLLPRFVREEPGSRGKTPEWPATSQPPSRPAVVRTLRAAHDKSA